MRISLIILMMVLLTACGRHRQVVKLKAVRNSKLIENLDNSQLEYQWYSAKISSSVGNGETKKSFKTNIKMRKDSMIWMSISPLLGIEIARVVITPDSIKFIDRINNQYFKGDLNYLSEKKNINVEFDVLQDMIVSNAIMFDPEEKFRSIKNESTYMITAKTNRKVRRAVGLYTGKKDEVMTMDTVIFDINERKYRKAIRKNKEEDLIIKRYWLSPDNWKPVKTMISDILLDRNIEADYHDFELISLADGYEKYLPKKVNYIFSDKNSILNISLKYNRIRIGRKSKLPFKIPKDFQSIELEE